MLSLDDLFAVISLDLSLPESLLSALSRLVLAFSLNLSRLLSSTVVLLPFPDEEAIEVDVFCEEPADGLLLPLLLLEPAFLFVSDFGDLERKTAKV